MATLNFNTVQALINKKYMPWLRDNIFREGNYLFTKLIRDSKTQDERKIVTALEYNKIGTGQFLARYGIKSMAPSEIATAAEWDYKMYTDSLSIAKEDVLENKSDMSIKNLTKSKVRNLKKSVEEDLAANFWARGVAVADANGYNTIDHIINDDATQSVGDIPASGNVPAWWKSNMIDASTLGGDPELESDLLNSSKNVHIVKLLRRGVARCMYRNEKPTVIVLPRYLWDMLESLPEFQKNSSSLTERFASFGFDALDFRHIPIVADDFMVDAQTGDNDGRIYFINEKYLYYFFNSGANFTLDEFVKAADQNSWSALFNAYGNLCITNRDAQTCITGLKSPANYVSG